MLRDDTKPHRWHGPPICDWLPVSDWDEGPPYTVGPTDTRDTEEKPDAQQTPAGTGTETRVGSDDACEEVEQLEKSRTRSVLQYKRRLDRGNLERLERSISIRLGGHGNLHRQAWGRNAE